MAPAKVSSEERENGQQRIPVLANGSTTARSGGSDDGRLVPLFTIQDPRHPLAPIVEFTAAGLVGFKSLWLAVFGLCSMTSTD